MSDRELAEKEVRTDKGKSDEQIMVDVYHELLNSARSDTENIKHGLKRLSGFFYNQNKVSSYMYRISILISVVALIFTFTNLFPVDKIYENISNPLMVILSGIFVLMIAAFITVLISLKKFRDRLVLFAISLLCFIGLVIIEIGLFAKLY